MKNSLIPAFAAFLMFSCSQSPQNLVDSRKEDAIKKFDQFYACYEIAKTTPPMHSDEIHYEEDDACMDYGDCQNCYQIGMESFKDLSEPLDIPFDGTRRREHADMAKLFGIDLSEHKEPHDYPVTENYSYQKIDNESGSCTNAILQFLDTKYLLINRMKTIHEPSMAGASQFNSGLVEGDVLVFDVEKAKLLGGFTVSSQNDQNVQTSSGRDIENVRADLEMNVQGVIRDKFKKLTPSLEGESFEF
ncbi:hypothetical protein K6119_01940 [Paracrocinitomix mangrovi]|uniref:hypothetical protein n=1 Tax=Paracrocinitomix mangrovi TaxID=2862509 RepID=UPI001C8E0813|nr:hypothetical protein [Paracrocinitomix mangrovi]UKN02279.1 hypothetical protein K6119_01940 [Paracrocinitomix mangrovi]